MKYSRNQILQDLLYLVTALVSTIQFNINLSQTTAIYISTYRAGFYFHTSIQVVSTLFICFVFDGSLQLI